MFFVCSLYSLVLRDMFWLKANSFGQCEKRVRVSESSLCSV